jgi:two-component system sensor histidine kinase KdpD
MNESNSATESAAPSRGTLRIFLGAAHGVGKTYAMLEAAQAQQTAGEDIVIGWLDTHNRPELQALAAQFEKIPPRRILLHDLMREELDLDRILARRPSLVLIDDLAHTNAPGARHPQRYLDVLELLDAGISVYTTLNVQHIESLNDTVARATGIRERETIPDSLLEQAEVTVIDLAPEELLQRLQQGLVHVPEKDADRVREQYQIGTLTILRELALRRAAEHADEQMRALSGSAATKERWSARERVMVCLEADDLAARLVHAARQMANSLRAEWIAVHVQTPQDYRRTLTERQTLEQAFALAQAHGARVETLSGQNALTALLDYAREQNVTKLVVGKHFHGRWRQALHTALADELIRRSGDMNVFVVTGEQPITAAELPPKTSRPGWLRGYLYSFLVVVGVTLFGLVVRALLAPTNIALIYLLAVVLSATSWGLGPAIFSSILAVLVFDVLFVPPYATLAVHDPQYFLTFIIFLGVGILISELVSRLRAQVSASQQRERETAALYVLSQSMMSDTNAGLDAALQQLNELLDGQALVLRTDASGTLQPYPPTPLSDAELQAAHWAFDHRQPAGRGTSAYPEAERLYLPLFTAHTSLGVLSVRPNHDLMLTREQRLLETFAGQMTLALERARLSAQAEQTRQLEASERFRNALLSSLSHDLRTPLASILGSVTSLLDERAHLSAETRRDLLTTIQEEATRLNRYVANLLNMTRLESGTLKPQRDWHSVEEVVGSALAHAGTNGHAVKLTLPSDLPLIPFDFVLIEQVLVNLLDNAYKFSPPGALIEISARLQDDYLQVSVADQGTKIPETELERIFDKFYRAPDGQRTAGLGLGLSIAKGIVEAHGGTVFAKQRAGAGMEIGFRLPTRRGEQTA